MNVYPHNYIYIILLYYLARMISFKTYNFDKLYLMCIQPRMRIDHILMYIFFHSIHIHVQVYYKQTRWVEVMFTGTYGVNEG